MEANAYAFRGNERRGDQSGHAPKVGIRAQLRAKMDAEITKRRIHKISFLHNGKTLVAEVGRPNPYNGVHIRAIYEDSKRGLLFDLRPHATIAPNDSLVEEAE